MSSTSPRAKLLCFPFSFKGSSHIRVVLIQEEGFAEVKEKIKRVLSGATRIRSRQRHYILSLIKAYGYYVEAPKSKQEVIVTGGTYIMLQLLLHREDVF